MKKVHNSALVYVIMCCIMLLSCNKEPLEKPNIILFLVDDMGWQDTSVPFWQEKTPINQGFRTPNMEKLGARGMKFTSAYACRLNFKVRFSQLNRVIPKFTHQVYDIVIGLTGDAAADGVV